MNTLVVYDSVFGNTEKIAQAIAAALGTRAVQVGHMTLEQLEGLEFLVVGSPTRGFRPTEGMASFLNSLPIRRLAGIRVAAFDTRILLDTINSKVFRFIVDKGGYAANAIAKILKGKGGELILPAEGFLVTGEQGPLKDGELERAAAWAKTILASLSYPEPG